VLAVLLRPDAETDDAFSRPGHVHDIGIDFPDQVARGLGQPRRLGRALGQNLLEYYGFLDSSWSRV
jgi:hypothetical protein